MDNGVRVLLKPTDFKNDEILFKALSPGGTSLSGDKDFLSANLATDIISESGIGNFSSIQLEKKLSGKIVNISPYISELYEGLKGSASPQDIETLFQLIFLHITAARLDSSAYNSFLTRTSGWLENWKSRPESVFQDTLTVTLSQNHIRKRPLTSEILTETDLHAAVNFYRDRFGDAGDFTFFFVGNFELAAIQPIVEMYLGSLPSTGRTETWRDVGMEMPTGIVENSRIDEIGILNATIDAMLIAITNLGVTPDFVLIDAVEIDVPYLPSKSIIRGDQISVSIAAGSIVAKVTRDRLMIEYDQIYPEYGFANNKGYPTEFHRKQLMELGPCQIHRFSFAPVHNACRGT